MIEAEAVAVARPGLDVEDSVVAGRRMGMVGEVEGEVVVALLLLVLVLVLAVVGWESPEDDGWGVGDVGVGWGWESVIFHVWVAYLQKVNTKYPSITIPSEDTPNSEPGHWYASYKESNFHY